MIRLLQELPDEERKSLEEEDPPHKPSPMLATLSHEPFSDPEWIFERKLDGERVVAVHRGGPAGEESGNGISGAEGRTDTPVRLLSRNGELLNETYPELEEALEDAGPSRKRTPVPFVVDGEVVAFSGGVTSFSRLQDRMKIREREEARASRVKVYHYLFDLLHLDGHDLTDLPLRRRKALLRRALSFSDPLRLLPHRNEAGESYHAKACEKGWEGIIAKEATSPYRHTRSRAWLKLKCVRGQELVIGGFTEPEGERIGFGALLVGYYREGDLRYAGKVGTGYDDETLEELRERLDGMERKTSPFVEPEKDDLPEKGVHWVTPKLVGEFGFTEWTDDGKLRHPRFKGLRRDKDPGDVVREDA